MRLKKFLLIGLLLIVVISIPALLQAEQQKSKAKIVWEYKTAEELTDKDMNQLGEEGWELAATVFNGSSARFYYKRLKKQ